MTIKPITIEALVETAEAARSNAKAQYLLQGDDMEAAMRRCEESHKLPELSLERAVYVGAYMDTIRRLAKK